GRYLVEIALVHEQVRWFDRPLAVPVEVVPTGRREANVPRRRWLPRRMRIPRLLHQVWVGSAPMADEQREFIAGWKRLHPDWEHRLWTDDDLPGLDISADLIRK